MRRKQRPIYFICSVIKDGKLMSFPIEAETEQIASTIFQQQIGIVPEIILGSFYKKQRPKEIKQIKKEPKLKPPPKISRYKYNIKLNTFDTNHGTYDGWNITYIPLQEDPDRAYVLFNKRVDNIKTPKPRINILQIKDIIGK
jgi:hypothetical protein